MLEMRFRAALWAAVAASGLIVCAVAGPVWVDLDNSAGLDGVRDVDNALALIQLLNSPEVEVVGISTTFGNAPSEETYAATQILLERFYPEYLPKLFKGANSPGDFSKSAVTDALGQAMRKHKSGNFNEQLEFLALGPLTNLAALLSQQEHRAFADDAIWRVVFVGGREKDQVFKVSDHKPTLPDLNFEKDVSAAETVLSSAIMLTMVGWEASSKLKVTRSDLEALAASGPATAANWAAEVSQPRLRFWAKEFEVDHFNPFDCLAVLHVTQPELVQCWNQLGWIEDAPKPTKSYFHAGQVTYKEGTQIVYCHTAKEGAKEAILQRIAAEPLHPVKLETQGVRIADEL